MSASPTPWRVSDKHGLCIVDATEHIVADLTPRSDWVEPPAPEVLRANAESIVGLANADFAAWIEFGKEKGWIADGVCQTHDLTPLTQDEALQFEEGGDPCVPIIRVWMENVT